jgi:DHA2 family multidrug resistance protein
MVLSPGGIAICVLMPVVGFLLRRFQARWLVILGVLISAGGLLAMSKFTLAIDYRTAVWGRVTQSLGLAFLFVPISTVAFTLIPKERINYATGLFNLARNIGGSSGIATVTTLLARRAQYHQAVLVSHLTPYDPAYRDITGKMASLFVSTGAGSVDASQQAAGLVYSTLLKQSSMLAFADAFWVMAVLFMAIIPLMFLLKKSGPAQGAIHVE